MGSGYEIVDGIREDFTVFSPSGNYSVAVSNTPFSGDFRSIGPVSEGEQSFDLSGTGLTSARYVRVTGAPEAAIDAVKALNLFVDAVRDSLPVADVDYATITMRRAKVPESKFDPWLELIAPNGSRMDRKRSGFGDKTSSIRHDAALINENLAQIGYYRFLGRGYELTQDEESFGTFFVRLESGGDYDPTEIIISDQDENGSTPQREGTIGLKRERDSYVFEADPGAGETINIVVNGTGNDPLTDPLVELFDPEGLLIAASDDFPGRGKNPVISLDLPGTSFNSGLLLPNPSVYRIVVSAIDERGSINYLSDGLGYTRTGAIMSLMFLLAR